MLECLVDGEIADRVSVMDRGLLYGDGLFETMAVMGGTPRFWQGHVDRLTAVDRQHAHAVSPDASAVAADGLGDLHGQLARRRQRHDLHVLALHVEPR